MLCGRRVQNLSAILQNSDLHPIFKCRSWGYKLELSYCIDAYQASEAVVMEVEPLETPLVLEGVLSQGLQEVALQVECVQGLHAVEGLLGDDLQGGVVEEEPLHRPPPHEDALRQDGQAVAGQDNLEIG